MSTNRSMPSGQVIPVLAYPDVTVAAAWLCAAFGFMERLRIGTHRIQLCFGRGSVVVVEGQPAVDPAAYATHSVMLCVANVDEHWVRAEQCGAIIVQRPTTFPYGERQYSAQDFAGHRWTFSETVADVDPAAWGGLLVAEDPSG